MSCNPISHGNWCSISTWPLCKMYVKGQNTIKWDTIDIDVLAESFAGLDEFFAYTGKKSNVFLDYGECFALRIICIPPKKVTHQIRIEWVTADHTLSTIRGGRAGGYHPKFHPFVYPEPEAYLVDHSCDHPADLSDQQVRGWTRRPGWGQRQESVRGHVQPFAVHHSCGLRGAPIRAQAIPAQQINLRSNGQQHGGRYRCLYRHAGIAKYQHTTRKSID